MRPEHSFQCAELPRVRSLERGEDSHFSKPLMRRRSPCRRYIPETAYRRQTTSIAEFPPWVHSCPLGSPKLPALNAGLLAPTEILASRGRKQSRAVLRALGQRRNFATSTRDADHLAVDGSVPLADKAMFAALKGLRQKGDGGVSAPELALPDLKRHWRRVGQGAP